MTNNQLTIRNKIANLRVFAYSDASGELGNEGINYRQWLIGMTLSGCSSIPGKNGDGIEPFEVAEFAIEVADATIALLMEEEKTLQQKKDLASARLHSIDDELKPHGGTWLLAGAIFNQDRLAVEKELANLHDEVQENLRSICDRLLNNEQH